MTQITASLIKELRERTNVGMAKCKAALVEANGDLETAVQNLRKAGLASASKKASREAKEGSIVKGESDSCVALVEVNAETDFVVRNELFQEFSTNVAREIATTRPADVNSLLQQQYSADNSVTVDEYRATMVQSIGENIQVSRFSCFDKANNQSIGVYSHQGGKIVALVEIAGSGDQEDLAREIAMHVAASRPEFLSQDTVPADILQRERDIARAQVDEQPKLKDKPEQVKDNIVNGKLKAFVDENCLLCQKYVKDEKATVEEFLAKESKETGKDLSIARFVLWSVGEGSNN